MTTGVPAVPGSSAASEPAEAARLAALRALAILDTGTEESFDEITALAAAICGVPIAAVSLIDADRQWFKSAQGLRVSETPREVAFCAHTVLEPAQQFVVQDAADDLRFKDNPLVTGDPHIRFYAGAPLVTRSGHAIGSLCVINNVPGRLTEQQAWMLEILARQATRLIENRAAARTLIETQSAIDAIISVDAGGRIVSFNDGAVGMFGYDSDFMIGRDVSRLIPDAFRAAHAAGMARLRAGGEPRLIGETVDVTAQRRDGSELSAELALSDWQRDGQRYFTAVIRDVTASRRTAALRALSEQAAVICNDSSQIGDAMIRLLSDLAGVAPARLAVAWLAQTHQAESPQAQSSQAQTQNMRWTLLAAKEPDGSSRVGTDLPEPVLLAEDCGLDGIYLSRQGGDEVVLSVPILLDNLVCAVLEIHGGPALGADLELRTTLLRVSSQIAQVAQRAQAIELTMRAMTDPLTGLANRRSIVDTITTRLASATVAGTLLFLDLDRFKNVNDSLGHGIGDQVLRAAADRLAELLRPRDVLARMGGDEFVVLCESAASPDEATAIAQRLIDSLIEPFSVQGLQVYLGVSIGIAILERDTNADTLLRQADIAMYRAKDAGGNRSAVFDSEMDRRFRRNLDTDSALHRAVRRGELMPYFQPIVNPRTRQINGLEALVRWNRAGFGLVAPDEFIPLAQDNGLIVPIGQFMLASACAQMVSWTAEQPGLAHSYVAVNVAAAELQGDYYDTVMQVLSDTGLAPERLTLEITESALLSDIERTSELLEKLRTAGISIALDDFGTGYSSLSYLRQLPVDTIKIDRSFITPLTTSPRAAALLDVVLDLARALDLSVVAEGIETQEQVELLRNRDCSAIQGFYYSKPRPGSEIAGLLTKSGSLRVQTASA